MRTYTPLRYPGGKAKIYHHMKKMINKNFNQKPVYCEPFVGGAGLALKLLLTDIVSEIYINDLDDAIFSFWYSVLNHKDELIERIINTEVTIDSWQLQKEIYENPDKFTIIERGFSTFFLNRTNRSGIMKAGPIGGKKQNGKYKLNCRYNKENLIKIIETIYLYRDKIEIYNLDAKDFISKVDKKLDNAFFYLDPPYVEKGPDLYKNSFTPNDHKLLRDKVASLNNKWFITYDDNEYIEKLYKIYKLDRFELNYSISTARKGVEISIYGPGVKL